MPGLSKEEYSTDTDILVVTCRRTLVRRHGIQMHFQIICVADNLSVCVIDKNIVSSE
jgi:hypothetical protein